MPDPVPIHLPPVTSRGPYAGVLRQLVSAYKDDGRRDLRPVLARPARPSRSIVAASGRPVVVVPMPSSRAAVRRRGDDPVGDLVAAGRRPGARAGPTVRTVLRPLRRLDDQSTLGHRERAAEPVRRLRGPRRRGRRPPGTDRRPGRRRRHDRCDPGRGGPRGPREGWTGRGRGDPGRHPATCLGGRACLPSSAWSRPAAISGTARRPKGYGRDRSPTLSRMGGGPSVSRACQARGEPSPTARRTTWTTTWTSS